MSPLLGKAGSIDNTTSVASAGVTKSRGSFSSTVVDSSRLDLAIHENVATASDGISQSGSNGPLKATTPLDISKFPTAPMKSPRLDSKPLHKQSVAKFRKNFNYLHKWTKNKIEKAGSHVSFFLSGNFCFLISFFCRFAHSFLNRFRPMQALKVAMLAPSTLLS